MHRRRKRRATLRFFVILLLALLVAALAMFLVASCSPEERPEREGGFFNFLKRATPTPEATPEASPTPPAEAGAPAAGSSALPEILGVVSELNLNGQDIQSYDGGEGFVFGDGDTYTNLEGVITFRGNHWRQGATYGAAKVENKTLTPVWNKQTYSLPKSDAARTEEGSANWNGNGWTGQPMLVRWPEGTRKAMNINEEKKNKDGLIEVIYPSMDGMVYFYDIEDGEPTRSRIDIGVPFKGAGCLDPRGYPLLYLGAGDATPEHHGRPYMQQEFFIYSLIDGKRVYSFGKNPDPYAPREWHAYDSAALIHAGTDTLIEPAENGILYVIKLNSAYDEAAGTVSVNPGDTLKLRYTTQRSRDGGEGAYWLGMESSAAMWRRWLYVADNCGTLLCIDTKTMEVVWAQDTLDDSNSSPVLEVEDGHPYIYISTSLHWTKDGSDRGAIPIWKIDGLSGEVVWRTDYTCYTVSGISGGVESTGLLGKNDIGDLVIYSIARTPDKGTGLLVALDKQSGDEVWRWPMQYYSWSSPVAVYDQSGKTYVVVCDSSGSMHLLDGQTGTLLDSLSLGGNIEASPAVFGDMIVVGSRGEKIWGIKVG